MKVPEGYSFEIYNRDDIEKIMVQPPGLSIRSQALCACKCMMASAERLGPPHLQGPAAKYISFRSAACRCFGFLVSKKKCAPSFLTSKIPKYPSFYHLKQPFAVPFVRLPTCVDDSVTRRRPL